MFEIYKIISWHKKIFRDCTYTEQLDKVSEEIREYTEALENYIKARGRLKKIFTKSKLDEELTDVIIASINCMRYPEIRERVNVKMEINKHRTFKNNHHIGG